MDLNKQIVDIWVDNLVKENPTWFEEEKNEEAKRSKAFELIAISAYLNSDYASCYELVVGQGDDLGIDAIKVGEVIDNSFEVVLLQANYKRDLEKDFHFPENKIIKSIQALRIIFNPRSDYSAHENLKPIIEEIRSLIMEGYLPAITFVLANNSDAWNQNGQKHIDDFIQREDRNKQVRFLHINHIDIVSNLQPARNINDKLQLAGAALNDKLEYKEVIVGKINVLEVFGLIERHGDALLEKNIRRFLGLRNGVNESIRATLLDKQDNRNFFFYNNGITLVCTKFSFNGLQSADWNVRLENMQIINGGQTCKTIHQTIKDLTNEKRQELGLDKVYVMVRLYELDDDVDSLVTDITRATNSQNPVDLRDLRANDKVQKQLEVQLHELGYQYKRKRDNTINFSPQIITNSAAAEAVMAVWRKKPYIARFQHIQLFSRYYDEIFKNLNGAQLIIAVLIYRYCDNQRRYLKNVQNTPHIMYSRHFVAMLMGSALLRSQKMQLSTLDHKNLQSILSYFEINKDKLYQEAISQLNNILDKYFESQDWRTVSFQRLSAVFRRADLISLIED